MTSTQPNASQKRKRCKVCKTMFVQFNSLVVVCSSRCAIEFAGLGEGKAHRQKAVRAETRERKRALKTRSDWMKDAEKSFNKFIRLRDESEGCISCGTLSPKIARYGKAGAWDAGHYRTKGACPELRFEELNVHKQCIHCNHHKSGNIVEYRIRIVEKIGAEKLAWLEGPHDPKNYTIEDLKNITATYKVKARELERRL